MAGVIMKTLISLFVLVLLVLVIPLGFSPHKPADLYYCPYESETRTSSEELEESHICKDIVVTRRNYNPYNPVLKDQQNFTHEYLTARFNTLLIIFFSALLR